MSNLLEYREVQLVCSSRLARYVGRRCVGVLQRRGRGGMQLRRG